MMLPRLKITQGMWCGLPMTITRCGYEKVIEQFKAKLDKEKEYLTKLESITKGNDLYLPAS